MPRSCRRVVSSREAVRAGLVGAARPSSWPDRTGARPDATFGVTLHDGARRRGSSRDLSDPLAATDEVGRARTAQEVAGKGSDGLTRRVRLPPPVAAIYRAVAELEASYPGRKFTPDGHLVGSIGEVVAAEALGLTLYPMSRAGHDAYDADGDVQIKMTAGGSVAMYAECVRLVVLRVVSPEEAEIVYDGPGEPAWANAGKSAKNGQRVVRLAKLRALAGAAEQAKSPV